jgi:hypothetical protein
VKILLLLILFALMKPYALSYANDGFGALGVGGVVLSKTDKIALNKEVLDISCDKIEVYYEFVNESDKDVTATIIFPLPTYHADPPESGIIAYGQPHEFIIRVNGAPVPFKTEVKAVDNQGKDVTSVLHSIGLSDKQIAGFPFDEKLIDSNHELQLSKQQIATLTETGLIHDHGYPLWGINVRYVWTHNFQAKKVLRVEHEYKPFISEGAAGGYQHEKGEPWVLDRYSLDRPDEKYNFCITKDQTARLDALMAEEENLDAYNEIPGTVVEYVLTTANSWKDGIRDFTLKVHPKSEDEVVAFCFPGGFEKKSPDLYQAHVKNFQPKGDLSIYFGNSRQCDSAGYGEMPQFLE